MLKKGYMTPLNTLPSCENTLLPEQLISFIREAASIGIREFEIERTRLETMIVHARGASTYLKQELNTKSLKDYNRATRQLPFGPKGRLAMILIKDQICALLIQHKTITLGSFVAPKIEYRQTI